jgi:uncharacterized protein
LEIKVKVIPRASRSEFAGTLEDGTVKVKLKAVPEDGKANQELIRFLAKEHGVPESSVKIVAGLTSQRKLVRVTPKG